MLTMYIMPLIISALGLAGYYLRSWTPADGFWHSKGGHAVISFGAAMVAAAVNWVQSGQLSEQTAVMAAVGAASGWLGALKPGQADPKASV